MGGLDMFSGAGDVGMKNFNALPGDPALFEDQYDVLAGRWPKEKNEIVVVLMDNGGLTDTTLYSLGLKDRKALEKLFEDFANDEELKIEEERYEKVDYDELLSVKLKLVDSAAKYQYDKNYDVWVDKSEDKKFMDQVIKDGMDMQVVGVVKASEETKTPMLSSGLYYPYELTEYLIQKASEYDVVKAQLKDPKKNVFTGKPFMSEESAEVEDLFNFEDFVSIDESKIQSAFQFDASALDMDFSDLDVNVDMSVLPEMDLNTLAVSIATQINVPTEEIQVILSSVLQDFVKTQEEAGVQSLEEWVQNFDAYIQSEKVQAQLLQDLKQLNDDTQIVKKISDIIQNYLRSYMEASMTAMIKSMQTDLSAQLEKKMMALASSMETAVSVDTDAFASAFQVNLDEDDFLSLMQGLGEKGQANAVSNLKMMGYRDLKEPSQINLYPKDFSTKDDVIQFIDAYNAKMETKMVRMIRL